MAEGMTTQPEPRAMDRFWEKVDRRGPDECWPWLGRRNENGYGKFWFQAHHVGAHRFAFVEAGGVIPTGLEIDHLCRNRSCMNPAHMEVVTKRENGRRSMSVSGVNARKTHCIHGHALTGSNLRVRSTDGRRVCRTCVIGWKAAQRTRSQS